jgi:hypothetical protein
MSINVILQQISMVVSISSNSVFSKNHLEKKSIVALLVENFLVAMS